MQDIECWIGVVDSGDHHQHSTPIVKSISRRPAFQLTEMQRKQRDQPKVMVHLIFAGFFFIVFSYVMSFDRFGLIAMAIAVTPCLFFAICAPISGSRAWRRTIATSLAPTL